MQPRSSRTATTPLFIVGLLAAAVLLGAADEPDVDVELLKSDSRAPYVHRITLYDHDGAAIDPGDEFAGPYSPRMTCAKCHPYAIISHGWHFNAALDDAFAGRPGEPWLLVDPQTGAPLPISGRGWPGTFSPADIGSSPWDFVKTFGHHTPGGGFGEPTDAQIAASEHKARWGISGRLEIDCMFCHSADQQHDPAEASRQIERQNFKWAATAALGLAVVRGAAKDAPDDWDPLMPPNPNYPEQAGPKLVWDQTRFDADDRVFFNITRRPPNERCQFCHSVRAVGPGAPPRMLAASDVHLTAGLLCVDCHRNGLDHMIVRGYRGEAAERGQPALATYSCEGCHLGVPDADDPAIRMGGRYGAPHPQHRGLPPLHFEELTCTVCHSGPWPRMNVQQIQTALAHGLGLPTRERTSDDPPHIAEPVFARQADGRIAPQRVFWTPGEADPQPFRWSIGHDVRPAAQALGVRDCTDCHAANAPICFGHVTTPATDREQPQTMTTMLALRGDDELLARTWVLGFAFRPAFKVFGFICAALIALILLRRGLEGFRGDGGERTGFTRLEHAFHWLAIAGVLIQVATGFGVSLIAGELAGWALLVHMTGASLFIVGLTGTAVRWAPRCRFGTRPGGLFAGQRIMFWVALVLGFATMLCMLAATLPVFGYAGQATLTALHQTGAVLLIVAMVVHTFISLAARQTRGKAK